MLTGTSLVALTVLVGPSVQAEPKPNKKPAGKSKAPDHDDEKKSAGKSKASDHDDEKKPAGKSKAPDRDDEKKSAGKSKAPDHDDEKKSAGRSTAPIRVVSHNVEKDVAKDSAIHQAVSVAKAMSADIIALQEVCPDQYDRLQKAHPDWTIGYMDQTLPAVVGCDIPGGHAHPRVVIAWLGGTDGSISTHELTDIKGARGNPMVCVKFTRKAVPVHACSVHLASTQWTSPEGVIHQGDDLRLRQTTGIKRIVSEWVAKDHFVVIAGDFNANPHRVEMGKMYDPQIPGGQGDFKGDFTEYNRPAGSRDGQDTAGEKKIDYIFFSTNRAPLNGGSFSVQKSDSDHRLVTSVAQMSIK